MGLMTASLSALDYKKNWMVKKQHTFTGKYRRSYVSDVDYVLFDEGYAKH